MKEQLISEIQRKMLPYLNNEQLMQLRSALSETLQGATVSFDEGMETEARDAVEALLRTSFASLWSRQKHSKYWLDTISILRYARQ